MSRRGRASVLVGMGETAGFCTQLTEGLRALGCRAEHLDLIPNPLGYSTNPSRPAVRLARALARRRGRPGRLSAVWRTAHRLVLGWLFVHGVIRYDAFVFRAGDSFFALRDLPLLRRLGKRVVVVFFGTDSRPSYLNGAEIEAGIDGEAAARATRAKLRLVRRIEASASDIVCHVLSAQLHRRPAIAFLEIGIPRSIPEDVPEVDQSDGPVRVLHAPSRSVGKGTELIRAAVERIRKRGVGIELTVLTGRSNAEVLAAIDHADFVVDQLYSDTPMAGFAAEAAARGRPALVGGYGWDELRRHTSPNALPPSALCSPDEFEHLLERLATQQHLRRGLGRSARAFVSQRWAPTAVAERMLVVIDGAAPPSWRFDPASIAYACGVGMSEAATASAVAAVLEAAGPDGLGVADKPLLERRLIALAGDRSPS